MSTSNLNHSIEYPSFKIRAAELEECNRRRGKETVDHFLFRCGWWSTLRGAHKIRSLAKSRWGNTAYLLGRWSGERKNVVLHNWKPNLKIVNATISLWKLQKDSVIIGGGLGKKTRKKEERGRTLKIHTVRVKGRNTRKEEEKENKESR